MANGPNDWNAERMLELATRHARVEAQKRLEELMETLVEEPVYEFLVQGLTIRGGERIRRYYRQFFDDYMSRVIGEKKARELWYMCRRYSAREALEMGLVNKVVPDDQLDAEVDEWCRELVERSPTAIAIAKRSFNADSENIRGIGMLGFQAVALYYGTDESKEGGAALREKRDPQFRRSR